MDVWATGSIDLAAWNKSFLAHTSFVAVDGETIAEFGDIDSSGYLDRLYVHKDHQGIGIATALCEKLEASVESATVTTHASITARPFFEDRGYVVKKRVTGRTTGNPTDQLCNGKTAKKYNLATCTF